MSPRLHSLPFILLALLFTARVPAMGAGNDLLANRFIIAGIPVLPVEGDTTSATVEAGELDETGAPAAAGAHSVWYEWTPQLSGRVFLLVNFPSFIPLYNGPLRGVAAYSLASPEAPVAMGNLALEGVLVSRSRDLNNGVRLRVTAGRKYLLRVWTAYSPLDQPGPYNYPAGVPFSLSFTFSAAESPAPGDLPSVALPLRLDADGRTWYSEAPREVTDSIAVEAADLLIGGKLYPSASVRWHRWQAGVEAGKPMRFSLLGGFLPGSDLLVARETSPGGPLALVAGPGVSVTFTPEPGVTYLARVSSPALRASGGSYAWPVLAGGPAEPGGIPAEARPIVPGVPLLLHPAGSSPEVSTTGPFVGASAGLWLDAGTGLSGRYVFTAGGGYGTGVYVADAAGLPGAVLAAGDPGVPASFRAEPGRRYLLRVVSPWYLRPVSVTVSLTAHPLPAPPHEVREQAVVLPAEGPVFLRGDATGAAAGEDGTFLWRGAGLWYALDRPAGGTPWYVHALGSDQNGVETGVFREEKGTLVRMQDSSYFTFPGGRVWIKVEAARDPRFLLMAGPVLTAGDAVEDAVPLTSGETRLLYGGTATRDAVPAPGLDARLNTQWFSWTAAKTGPVVFTSQGSSGSRPDAWIFTAALEPVETTVWTPGVRTTVSFHAAAGQSYRIVLAGFNPPVIVCARIQPDGWESPYDLWLLNFPARENDPALTDPLADPDGDGVANLIEMGLGTNPFYVELSGFPHGTDFGDYGRPLLIFSELLWVLRGAEGSRPFTMELEGSADLKVWTPVPHTVLQSDGMLRNHQDNWPPRTGDGDVPREYYRLRMSR